MCFVAALSGSCSLSQPATEVMLVIDADTKAKMLGLNLQVDIEGRTADNHIDGMPISRAFSPQEPSGPGWPLSLSITPRGGDARRSFQVTATLSDNKGKIAVLRARSGFVAKHSIQLPLYFSDDCLNAASLDCGEAETCLEGTCVDAFVDASALPPWVPRDIDTLNRAADGGLDSMSSSKQNPVQGTGGAKSPGTAGNASRPGSDSLQGPGAGAGGTGGSGTEDAGATPITTAPGDCGDGQINPGEKCDTGIPAGEPGACPTECASTNPCKPATLEGSGCQTQCMEYEITQTEAGDGCCPPGVDAKDDSDCGALCGNGVQEAGEKCDPRETCPTLESCKPKDPSLRAKLVGDAESCSADCVMEKITECTSGDGTCPTGCNHGNDTDCSAACGDGTVDARAGELCEPTSATLPCPTSCTDADPCTTEFLTGDEKTCNLVCTHVPVVVPIPGDGCCPAGSNANSDPECKAVCGNGIVETGERCDGRCPKTAADCNDNNPCTNDLLEGSGCSIRCVHNLINTADKTKSDSCCPRGANANNDIDCKPVCGNGVKEGDELCDGNDCQRCADNDPCTRDVRGGTNCNPTCMHVTITMIDPRDQCCVNGENSSTDPSCTNGPPPTGPVCGDKKTEGTEKCDGDNCATLCNDTDPCTSNEPAAGPDACHPSCPHTPIGAKPGVKDSCCPPGANSASDGDCTNDPPPTGPVCGDGKTEGTEKCDGANCATFCDDTDPCTSNEPVRGTDDCHPTCPHTRIGPKPGTKDTCCPDGADSSTDGDCTNPPPPKCGDGKPDPGEKCDGDCPTAASCNDNNPCTEDEITGSAAMCTAECKHTAAKLGAADGCCPNGGNANSDGDCKADCGNGVVEPGEDCEGESSTCSRCKTVVPPPPPDPPVGGAPAP